MINGRDEGGERLDGDEIRMKAIIIGDLNDKQSSINLFVRENQVQVLRRETGNSPNVFYVGIEMEFT